MDNLTAQILAAKKAGYSDQEITNHLSQDKTLGPQIQTAAKAGYSPTEIVAHMSQPPALSDTALKYSAGSGVANFLDAIPNAITGAANLGIAAYGVGKHALTGSNDLPDTLPPDLLSGYSKIGHATGLINDNYAPVTPAGKVTDMTTQTLTGGGINPAAIARNAARGAVLPIIRDLSAATASGVGAGVANVATQNVNTGNTTLDNAIKIGSTAAGGMAPGGLIAARGTAGDRAAAAINGVSPENMALAKVLAQKAADQGSPITGYEAIQAQTGTNPKMQTQQRVVEQSDAAANNLTPMMQARPQNNTTLFNNAVDQIAPQSSYPDTLAGRLQTASQKAIQAARDQGNSAAGPWYARSSNDPSVRIPSSDWNNLTSDPGIAAALDAVKKDPFSGLQDATEGSLQWLDSAKKWLDSQSQSSAQAGDRFAASNKSNAAGAITSTVDPLSPDYAKARAIVADNMQNNVTPLEQGQVGKLSRSDDFGAQSRELLPRKPLDVNENVIANTAGQIGAQDPQIMPQFLAQALRSDFNESNQGNNPMGGSQFAKLTADNPQQKSNLLQALNSAGADPGPLNDALDIFNAQGYKPPVNSATTANAAESAKLGGVLSMLSRPTQAIPGLVDNWRNGLSTKYLAQALSSGGNTVDDITSLARANGTYNPLQQQLMINLLNSTKNLDAPQDQ
jgi:hypothetical protein